MDKRNIFLILFISLLFAGVAIFVALRSNNKVGQAGGTMSTLCPDRMYPTGELFISPCNLKPSEECTWFNESNCELKIKNIGDTPIHKGQRSEVFKSTVKGTVQFLEIHIIEIQ